MKSSIPTKIVAAISRLKAKILSIVSILENVISYLLSLIYYRNVHIDNDTAITLMLQLLSLCEAESISYLDEVASSSQSLNLAKSVASEVSFQLVACTAKC